MSASEEILLRAVSVTKVFPGTVALDGVDFNAYRGKVNVLVGENGAGKSTLMKIIAGAEQPTAGKLVMEGHPVRFHSPLEAQSYGVGIIYQELDLCRNLSVSDNIFLTREIAPRGVINFKKQREASKRLLARLEHSIDPEKKVADLGVSSQQIVAIAKALAQNVKILIMDEPTSALTADEVSILFRVVRELKAQGVTIVYISHRLEEVLQIGDFISVLRDGKMRAEATVGDIDVNWIIEKMVGKSLSAPPPREGGAAKRVLLEVLGLSYARVEGGHHVKGASFFVRSGEIVGLYGLMGAGRTELLECVIGLHPDASGDVVVDGSPLPKSASVGERIARGLILVPEDRQAAGIVKTLTVGGNVILASVGGYARMGILPRNAGKSEILDMIRQLSIRVSSSDQLITALSGGNQQKVVVAKALLTKPKVLLMDEPTRGIDVNAKSEIFAIMNGLARTGIGILFASSELKEIVALSDRVIVMAGGAVTGEFGRGAYTEADLVAAAARDRVAPRSSGEG